MPKVSASHLAARREQIIEAAKALFAERGFSRTTMADVVAASGLSTGAVYHYFSNKHRKETRGVGGIFFDDLDEQEKDQDYLVGHLTPTLH